MIPWFVACAQLLHLEGDDGLECVRIRAVCTSRVVLTEFMNALAEIHESKPRTAPEGSELFATF